MASKSNHALPLLESFLKELQSGGFSGDCHTDHATRLVNSTDNSAYQILPQAILCPKHQADIQKIFSLSSQESFRELSFTPRGGGTGTNGQALTTGVVIECSKYMNNILEVNLEEGWARVQPGVVLDQLNAYLKPHGVFFAPTVSPGDRATLAGMVNTDACGQGSMLYGKTSNHVLDITAVYSDGSVHTSHAIDPSTLASLKTQTDLLGGIYRQVDETVCQCKEEIAAQFPTLTRFMTGYNLAHVYKDSDQFNLNAIISGSEGTLLTVTELKLKLTPLPKYKSLLVLQYDDFHTALLHARELINDNPAAIETINDAILELAEGDVLYSQLTDYITSDHSAVRAINLVEFVGDDENELNGRVQGLISRLSKKGSLCSAYKLAETQEAVADLWSFRKKSVGLLGKVKGARKPTSGMEDTVVPPEKLADFIAEFRGLLDAEGLQYGMFGHVDAGCLHVRPALDLSDPKDEALYHELSNKICDLTKKYGGLMWGEHGKGYRSEYVPMFFGETLYGELEKIKRAFDPYNQINPGKIAVPYGSTANLVSVKADKRGYYDREIDDAFREEHSAVLSCNGNGACFNYSSQAIMCPSYKVTRDRRHSPKGRASLFREWLRLASRNKKTSKISSRLINTIKKRMGQYDYSNEVYESMNHCLGCKGCVTLCPVSVNIPEVKSHFLQQYHRRYLRPARDYLIASSERMAALQSRLPGFWNAVLYNRLSRLITKHCFKLADLPAFSKPSLLGLCKQCSIKTISLKELRLEKEKDNAVVILQDCLTSSYNANLVVDTVNLLKKLGFTPYLFERLSSGKPLHVKGFEESFGRQAKRASAVLEEINDLGFEMIGIDPSITLSYRDEYVKLLGEPEFTVRLIQEWLAGKLNSKVLDIKPLKKTVKLFMHCNEQASSPDLSRAWKGVFAQCGVAVEVVKVGCCGMAGAYGHESEHQSDSKKLFELSWSSEIEPGETILVTGFSCQSQVKRFAGCEVMHPVSYLLNLL
jgi:FAD/FMN-containing dehydrogenase/Fe-S oxidoreductase